MTDKKTDREYNLVNERYGGPETVTLTELQTLLRDVFDDTETELCERIGDGIYECQSGELVATALEEDETMTYETMADAKTAVDNSGVIEWDWGIDSDEALAKLATYCYDNDADPNDDDTLHAFITEVLGQDPADYSLTKEQTMTDNLMDKITDQTGAELTNRLIPGDESYEYPEWREEATLNGRRVRIYYRTTPEDAATAGEANDWSMIPWEDRVDRIVFVDEE